MNQNEANRNIGPRVVSLAPLVFVLLLTFLLQLFRLGHQPVWYDEIYSIAVAHHPAAEVA